MEELLFRPANQLAALIRQRRVSAVDLIETHLAQIALHNRTLNAIVSLDDEGACQRAWEADQALARGECWGPLHGVPFTLKDHQDTVGLRSTMGGYPPFLERMPDTDSTTAARLRAAGAILLGKSNAVFFPFGAFGRSNNPWDPTRCPGVSSSGAAAALAAGLTPLDVGTDTSGSVLLPAHNCGIVGLRPTVHRVPLTGLTTAWSSERFRSLTVFGPMARSVEDVRLVLKVIAGPDGCDNDVPPVPWRVVPSMSLSEIRIAWTASSPGAHIGDEIRLAIEGLAAQLRQFGAKIECCQPPVDFTRQSDVGRLLMVQVMLDALFQPATLEDGDGSQPSLGDYLRLLDERDRFISVWEHFLAEWDAFLCPVSGLTAQPHRDASMTLEGDSPDQEAASIPFRLAAVTGNPSVVIPIARDASGLPIGAQLIGRRWQDERLLEIATQVAEITGGYCRPPGF